jgi:NhaC family Na+:H+ antiporter
MEVMTIVLFLLALAACVITGASILYALLAGYVIFFAYGLWKKFSPSALLHMTWSGIVTVKNILIVFLLIGMISAVWRASGTIPMIIYTAGGFIRPAAFLVITFLLNCLLSILTGTSFGTSATMGVICMSIGTAMGMNPVYMGGAILGGAFFGDRCSPMSTSALLTAVLTKTDIFTNIKLMVKRAVVPFVLTCAIYGWLGSTSGAGSMNLEILQMFKDNFNLHWLTLLPALLIIVLSIFKISVKKTMLVSIITACVLCLTLQNNSLSELVQMLLTGYQAPDTRLTKILSGGGVVSMLRASAIVGISSSYSGIFSGTGLLDGIKGKIAQLAEKCTPFGSTLIMSFLTGMVACNQTLAIMLTDQLCADTEKDKQTFALTLEDTVVLTAALVPWSIASAVPLASVGAPALSIAFACYLYLQPLWSLFINNKK